MKQFLLLVLSTVMLSSASAQSQKVTGTLLPKIGKPITVLPTSIIGIDTIVKVTTPKKIEKKAKAARSNFIFTKPVVQGKSQNNVQQTTTVASPSPFNNEPKTLTIDARKPTVQLSSTPGQTIPTNNQVIQSKDELKYEEPPVVVVAAPINSVTTNNTDTVIENVSSLVYGPPPTTSSSKLRSPKIQGIYKPELNQPIILVPLAPEDLESNQPKPKADSVIEIAKPVEPAKFIEEVTPKLIYTEPPTVSNLQSPKIEGTYTATKNNPYILLPVPTDSVSSANNASYPQQINNNVASTLTNNNSKIEPEKYSIKTTKTRKPTVGKKSFNNKFLKPVIQTNDAQSNNQPPITVSNIAKQDKPVISDQQQTASSGIKSDYKFYLTPSGNYNIVFDALGSSISVTSFGRVSDFTLPSTGSNIKPSYNYRGLIDAIGNLPLQYNYEGRIAAVGATQLSYNYNGAIEKVGDTYIYYNYNGTVDKIGSSKISYDYLGNIATMDKNPMILVKQ